MTDDELLEISLKNQVEEAKDSVPDVEQKQVESNTANVDITGEENPAAKYIGTKLNHMPGDNPFVDKEADKQMIEQKRLTKVGEKIGQNAEIREGWIDVDKLLLGERAKFYPEDWNFRIRPATVEAIRNWSNIDDDNPSVVDDVFNEIIKSCIMIVTPQGQLPWGNINSWDRFFFLMLIKEYTFRSGEQVISFEEECPECENEVKFELTSQTLMYEYPDPEIMKYYSQEDRCWYIDPSEFDIEGEQPIQLYLPTLEKDAAVKAWVISRLQENRNRKIDQTFLRFVTWLTPKISKDATIANRQIKELDIKYKSWDIEMFSFMDDVIKNIIVTPLTKLTTTCPVCGEEVTATIRFPNRVSSLFSVKTRSKKFGSK